MIIAALAILGLILGSFVNALVWRLHEQAGLAEQRAKRKEQRKQQKQKTKNNKQLTAEALSITKGRSMCPHCHHELAAKDLVPVFSWLALRGRCRYCRAPISWQYPVIELLTAVLFVVSYLSWPSSISHLPSNAIFMCWLVFLVGFVALAVYDLRWYLLPDRLVFPLVGLAVAQVVLVAAWLPSWSALWQPALGALIIFGLFWVLFQISGGNWIGGGDVKLALVLGLLAGTPLRAFLVIFFASLLGTLTSLPLLLRGRAGLKLHIPFGPYLLAAIFMVQLYGSHIVSWYEKLLVV